jgi:hypothetical protein
LCPFCPIADYRVAAYTRQQSRTDMR